MSLLHAEHLQKQYKGRTVVRDVALEVKSGGGKQVLALAGARRIAEGADLLRAVGAAAYLDAFATQFELALTHHDIAAVHGDPGLFVDFDAARA